MLANEASEGERRPYYVSVQAAQILEDPETASYELVINASDEEVVQLHELFKELNAADNGSMRRNTTNPYSTASEEQIHENYDSLLLEVYRHLHKWGTDETKRHIESMNLL